MAWDFGVLNKKSAGKKIAMGTQGSVPSIVPAPYEQQDMNIPQTPAPIANQPFVVTNPDGSKKSNIFGAITTKLKNYGRDSNPAYLADSNVSADATNRAGAQPITSVPMLSSHTGQQTITPQVNPMRGFDNPNINGVTGKPRTGRFGNTAKPIAPGTPVKTTPVAGPFPAAGEVQTSGAKPVPAPITRIQGIDPAKASEMLAGGWEPPTGGGVAVSGDQAYMLAGRTPTEEKELQASIAAQKAAQPIAPLATGTQYVSEDQRIWQEGQNLKNRLEALAPQDTSVAGMLKNKIARNTMKDLAQVGHADASANSLNINAGLAVNEQPYKIAGSIADTNYKNFATSKGIEMLPLDKETARAGIDNTRTGTARTVALLPGEVKKQDADIRQSDSITNARNLETPANVTESLARTAAAFAALKNPSKGDSQDAKYLQDRLMLYEKGIAEGTIALEQVPADIRAFWEHKKMTPGARKS